MWGRELYFDATKVEANAGIPSLIPRFYYEAKAHLTILFTEERDASDTKAPSTTRIAFDFFIESSLSDQDSVSAAVARRCKRSGIGVHRRFPGREQGV